MIVKVKLQLHDHESVKNIAFRPSPHFFCYETVSDTESDAVTRLGYNSPDFHVLNMSEGGPTFFELKSPASDLAAFLHLDRICLYILLKLV